MPLQPRVDDLPHGPKWADRVRLRREEALDAARDWAARLQGDIVLLPFKDGEPDWNVGRGDLDYPDINIEPDDIPRLAILTEDFHRFTDNVPLLAGVSVVTWWNERGAEHVRMVEGEPDYEAVATGLVQRAIETREPIHAMRRVLTAANSNPGGATQVSVPVRPMLPTIDLSEWQGVTVPERDWYIDGLVPSRNVTLLSGDGGMGKSLVALQIGIASALGKSTMGLAPVFGRCLYIGAEDEADEFHRRVDDILRQHKASYADLGGRFLLSPLAGRDATLARPDRGKTMQPTLMFDGLRNRAAEFEPDLIVLDTSADLFDGNEIDRVQVRQFVGMLRGLAIEQDCAILLLTHPSVSGMQSGTGTSGSTAWNNSVRSRLYLTAPTGDGSDPDARTITSMKSNYGKKGGVLNVRWADGVFVDHDASKPSPANGLMNKKADLVFVELLSKLNRQGQRLSPSPSQTYAPKIMATQPEADGITKAQFVAAQQRLLDAGTISIIEEGSPSRRYKRLIVSAEDFGPEGQT